VRGDRSVIVPVGSVALITVEDGIVWLSTDEGRLRSAGRSLDQLERALAGAGFVRVSRTALVNVDHVRELAPAFKGAVWISVEGVRAPVAVSRRRVGPLRTALGI
jgi:DNA-binding LytR/AlgR family response regulator